MGELTAAEQANVHFNNAIKLEGKGRDPIAEYSRGLALAPAEWVYQNRGWAYFKRGDFALAVADWERSGNEYALPLGRAKLKVGDVDGAIACLERAQVDDDDGDVRPYLAEAYAAKGIPLPGAAKTRTKAPPYVPPKRKKAESYDAYVARALEAAPLEAATKKAIAERRRTAIFVTKAKSPLTLGSSRLGGLPDLPAGTSWPRAGKKSLSFVGQIRLDEVAKVTKTALPRKGILSFFVSEDEDTYLERATVLHVDAKHLAPAPLPSDFKRATYKPRSLAFERAHKLPSPSNQVFKKMKWDTGEEEAYEALYEATVDFSRHQLLGYRDRSYDGEQKASTALLFQCFSEADMTWGDDDHVYFYIAETALAGGDFTKATAYSGE